MEKNSPLPLRQIIAKGILILVLGTAALALKSHYSNARGEDLAWILRPTAGFVEMATGAHFTDEGNEGYLSRDKQVCIVPSCAGVNFLIISFLLAGFSGVFRLHANVVTSCWLVAAAALAYAMTLLSNTVRIIVSIDLYQADIYFGWITPERVHRAEGIVLYLLFLYLFYLLISNLIARLSTLETRVPWCNKSWASGGQSGQSIPFAGQMVGKVINNDPRLLLFLYLSVVLGIPVLNGAFLTDLPRFLEHGLTVLILSAGFYVLIRNRSKT